MIPITRRDLEILLDTPDTQDYIVSAFADMTVQDGFNRYVDVHVRNQARSAGDALADVAARKALEENIEVVLQAVRTAEPSAKGLAVYSSVARKLRHVVPVDFRVENQLVIDEEPFVLPLLERWYGDPAFLVAVADSRSAHLFEAYAGVPEEVREINRPIDEDTQRDKPRFTYKKRFAQTQHEYLHGLEEDGFLKDVAQALADSWKGNHFSGLLLLGQAPVTSALRRLLPRELDHAVVEEAAQPMTSRPDDVADDVERALQRWRTDRERTLMVELSERWKQDNHMVANGPTDVLDALQQGRAVQVVVGTRRDLIGARCGSCGYRFGAPVGTCVYCNGRCRPNNAVQEILRMAMRHRVPTFLFPRNRKDNPLAPARGVAALLRAEANWAPSAEVARASQGH